MNLEPTPGLMSGAPAPPVDLAHRDDGKGPPALFLHGMGGDRLLWNPVTTQLSPNLRCIVPDLRGHGATPAPAGSQLSLEEMEGDVLALLDRISLPTVHLVGHSAGAFLALRIALDHPERVRSLILVSGAAYCDNHARSIIDRWWSTYAEEGADGLALRFLKDLYYPDWVEAHMEFVDQLYADVERRDFAGAVAWGRALKTFDERNSITAIRIPTLVVQAMEDQVVDASHGRILRQSIPGSLIRIFAQTGHMVPIERPTELSEAISEHARRAEEKEPAPKAE
jgi:pimeloyl-ACP methyl ester carboxylesterase